MGPILKGDSILFQKCYEQKQYKAGLKYAKQILTTPKFAEHGGRSHLLHFFFSVTLGLMEGCVFIL